MNAKTILAALRAYFGEGFDDEWAQLTNVEKVQIGRLFREVWTEGK